MNNLSIFNYQNMGTVRVVIGEQGEPWFCLSDICDILEIINSRDVIKRLESGGVDTIYTVTSVTSQYGATYDQTNPLTFVNEPGLYEVIFQSRKPEAKEFRKWVFEEVLPMIRQTGAYFSDSLYIDLINDPDKFSLFLDGYKKVYDRMKMLEPKAERYDEFINGEGLFSVGTVAKSLGYKHPTNPRKLIGRNLLYEILRNNNILIDSHKYKERNMPIQQYVDSGYFTVIYNKMPNGREYASVRVTPKGVVFIYDLLKESRYRDWETDRKSVV